MRRLVFFLMIAAFTASAQNTQDTLRFSTHFLETRLQIGPGDSEPDHAMINLGVGFGLQYAHVPEHWGWYGSLSFATGPKKDYAGAVCGVVYRPFDTSQKIDIQFYSGVTLACKFDHHLTPRLGLDGGLRIAPGAKANRSKFAWTSLAMGLTNYWDRPFFTMSFSLDLTAVVTGLLFLRLHNF